MKFQPIAFGDAFEIQLGKMLDKQKNVGELRPYLGNRDVQWGKCNTQNLAEMRFTESDRERFLLMPGDLLVCEGGEVGRTAIWNGEIGDCYYQKAIHRLRPKQNIEPRFVLHYMRWAADRNLFARLTSATSIAHLTKEKLREVSIPIPHNSGKPDLNEQKRIAAILDKAGAIRRKCQDALRLSDDFLRSLFLDMFGDPATNSKGLPVGVIGDLLESANYGTSKKASADSGDYAILRMGNITYEGGWNLKELKYIDLDSKEVTKHLVHNGQLLFNRTNSKELVGKTAVYRGEKPMAFAGYLVRGVAKADADVEFIAAYLNSRHGKKTLTQMCKSIVGMANINAKEMQTIPILLPPPAAQRRFGDIVRDIEGKRANWNGAIREAEDLFSSCQQRAFRGEL